MTPSSDGTVDQLGSDGGAEADRDHVRRSYEIDVLDGVDVFVRCGYPHIAQSAELVHLERTAVAGADDRAIAGDGQILKRLHLVRLEAAAGPIALHGHQPSLVLPGKSIGECGPSVTRNRLLTHGEAPAFACVAAASARARSSCTSSSVVCEKSSYQRPTARKGSGVRRQTI